MKAIKDYRTPKTRDDLVYVFEDNDFKFYQVKEVLGNDTFQCLQLNAEKKQYRRHPDLEFDYVGVFQSRGLKTTTRNIHLSQVSGKVYKYKGLIMTIPLNVLKEV